MKKAFIVLLILFISVQLLPIGSKAEAAKMTQYRVYQNDKPLKEFATQAQAISYAKYYNYSHVEKITNREWVWDNIPRYKVYINGTSSTSLEFQTLDEAKKVAAKSINSYVRDIEAKGWAYENYANYRLYQGDKTYANWEFYSLEAAKKEAKKWTNAHIINLNSKQWEWDNLSDNQVKQQRDGEQVYSIIREGGVVAGSKAYSFLKDAILAANKLSNVEVINTKTDQIVHSNLLNYEVYSNGKLVKKHSTLDAAVATAKKQNAAEVKQTNQLLWSSVPSFSIIQDDKLVRSVHSLKSALKIAATLSNASVENLEGRKLWSSSKSFIYMGWNGSSSTTTIRNHLANTQGLDIDSPTWYYLEDETGALSDTSNRELVAEVKAQGIDIIPLVHNQFDKEMTSKFLANEAAQQKFIQALMKSLVSLKVKGVNLDFESIAAKDRNAYTNFVKRFTEAAHKNKLTVSIDLLRGDVRWNHQTAYDYEAIGKIVDYVVIMAYDEHWSGSDQAGSVSSLSWAEEGIKQHLEYGIPRNKLIMGIPFYAREWRINDKGQLVDNKTLLMKDLKNFIAANNATREFDQAAGQYKVTYNKDGYTHVFWEETEDTVLARIKIAKKYDLAGIAAWRLGYEDAQLWEKMLKMKEQ